MKNSLRCILLWMILLPLAIACQKQPDQWTYGVALYSFNRFPFVEALDKAKTAGATHVEGFSFHKLGTAFGDTALLSLSDEQINRMKSLMDDRGLRMRSMYVSNAKTEAEWINVFEVGQKLGLEFFVGEPDPEDADLLNDLAGRYGIRIAIHQHAEGRSRYWHPDSVLAVLAGREHFGVCGDLGHWARSGLDPVACLKTLKGKLISIHAKDLDAAGDLEAQDVTMGTGVIRYDHVFEELARQQFDGPIYVECEHDWEDNLASVRAGIDLLTAPR